MQLISIVISRNEMKVKTDSSKIWNDAEEWYDGRIVYSQ